MADQNIQNNVINHARADMAADPAMSHDAPARSGQSFWAQMAAMGREMIKDIRQTMNEVMFGHHEHAPELGTPMNPTPQMTTEAIKGFDAEMAMYASRAQTQDQAQAMER